jgi:MoxR-like ATPase
LVQLNPAPGLETTIVTLLKSAAYPNRAALRAALVTHDVPITNSRSFHGAFDRAMTRLLSSGAIAQTATGIHVWGGPQSAKPQEDVSRDWSRNPVSRDSVLAAIAEFDREGRDETLARHGFRRALDYVVVHEGNEYDSKALYGIAYGIEYPDEAPIRDRGLSGGTAVTRKLEALGFTIKRLRFPADAALTRPNARAWIIRAGREGENEDLARDHNIALIGWSELGPISAETTRDELKALIRGTGEDRESSINAQASSIYRFIHELQDGDLVVLPLLRDRGKASIGVVDGPFQYRPDGFFTGRDAHYQRPVRWLAWALPYELFDADLRSAFRAQGTVSEIQRDGSVSRLLATTRAAGERAPTATRAPTRSPQSAEAPPPEQSEPIPPSPRSSYVEPPLELIEASIRGLGLRIDRRTLRRYHVSLKTRGFVVLAGVSGGGKSWLAEAYAAAVGAASLMVPVAPNWSTNEDLLGYFNPVDGAYRHTPFSRFLIRAADEHEDARASGREPRPFHLILDEMNLARVEHYFATFLSGLESTARHGSSTITLSDELAVALTSNLKVIGTVNVDETTFGFADKVYDRAQLIELEAPRDALAAHMDGAPFRDTLLTVWDAVSPVAPFAFRVVDEVATYVDRSGSLGVTWQEALDDQLLQKVLPKLKGTDPKLRGALELLVAATADEFPLSHAKATRMLDDFTVHGLVSYF